MVVKYSTKGKLSIKPRFYLDGICLEENLVKRRMETKAIHSKAKSILEKSETILR